MTTEFYRGNVVTRTYGAFSAVLDMNASGEVIYSNLHPEAPEYSRMYHAAKAFWIEYKFKPM